LATRSWHPGRSTAPGRALTSPSWGELFAYRQDLEDSMAEPERRYGPAGGLTLGGIIVIVGIVLMIVWSFWIGLIIALAGLIAFGGFARGKWY
jgi:fatty acid desaturase